MALFFSKRHVLLFLLSFRNDFNKPKMSVEPVEDIPVKEETPVPNVVVEEKKEVPQKLPSQWPSTSLVSIIIVILSIVALNIHSIFTIPANIYIRHKYLPEEILTHYIENPLNDISFNIPIYFDSEIKFPDFPDAVGIQVRSRMNNEFYTMLNYSINMIPALVDNHFDGIYPIEDLFVNCRIGDSNAIQIDGARNYAELFFNLEGIDANDVPFFMTQLLIDHCYKEEIEKYSPDHFIVLRENQTNIEGIPAVKNSTRYHLKHMDTKTDLFIPDLLQNSLEKKNVNVTIHVVGGNTFNIEMEQAMHKYFASTLQGMSEYHLFEVNIEAIDMEDTQLVQEWNDADGIFPPELTQLPIIWDLYKKTNRQINPSDKDINIHMLFYPYLQGGEFIKQLSVENRLIYAENENTYLRIGDWGSIYFSHLQYHESFSLEASHLRDCIWSFSQSLLDILGVPSNNMAPTTRIKIYKRFMIMQYLAYYSELLHELRAELTWDWSDLSALSKLDPARTKKLADGFHESMKIRHQVAECTKIDDLTTAVNICRFMIDTLQNALKP